MGELTIEREIKVGSSFGYHELKFFACSWTVTRWPWNSNLRLCISISFSEFLLKQHDKLRTYELEGNEAYRGVLTTLEVHVFPELLLSVLINTLDTWQGWLSTYRQFKIVQDEKISTVDLTLIYYLQDSAAWYENEVGLAILDFCKTIGIARETIFHITKLKLINGYDNAKGAIQRSLNACRLGCVDLYLIHGPLSCWAAQKER